MCGIIGYVGPREASRVVVEGLDIAVPDDRFSVIVGPKTVSESQIPAA